MENVSIGPVLRSLRANSKHPSLESLAAESGLSVSYLSLLERGKREPTLSALSKIADALGVPLPVFFLLVYAEQSQGKPSNAIESVARATRQILERREGNSAA